MLVPSPPPPSPIALEQEQFEFVTEAIALSTEQATFLEATAPEQAPVGVPLRERIAEPLAEQPQEMTPKAPAMSPVSPTPAPSPRTMTVSTPRTISRPSPRPVSDQPQRVIPRPIAYKLPAQFKLVPLVTPLRFPLALPAAITSAFGWRVHPISGTRRFHSGTDLGAAIGTPVHAAYAGRVEIAHWQGGYGNLIELHHGHQKTRYAHLSKIVVKPGQRVQQGSVIGLVGSTGNSTGPHLHFELLKLTSNGWSAIDSGPQLTIAIKQLKYYSRR
jgi:murein DD-endopeptidase MepM/ murein hydrolase activator NlpD